MFDVYRTKPQERKATPVLISITGHVVILTFAVLIPILFATDVLPKVPTMMAFVASMPEAPPPPPPPPPPAERVRAAEAPKELPADAFAAPIEAPTEIRPEPADLPVASRGVEGGVIGGVQGGIVGGLVAAPPPPPPPPPPPESPKQPVRIGGNVQAPALVRRVEPTYPDIAVAAHVTGMVILEATVTADGSVESVRVLRSVKLLDQAAVDAVKQWKYSPLMLNGTATPFVLTVTLNFSVKDSSH